MTQITSGKPAASITFRSPINIERSSSAHSENLSPDTESTMDFYIAAGTERRGWIEWDIPELEMSEEIGIWWDHNMELCDYDGIFELPEQAIPLLESAGIKVGEDYRDC